MALRWYGAVLHVGLHYPYHVVYGPRLTSSTPRSSACACSRRRASSPLNIRRSGLLSRPCSQHYHPSAPSVLVFWACLGIFPHIPRHHHLLVHPRTRAYFRPVHTRSASIVSASRVPAPTASRRSSSRKPPPRLLPLLLSLALHCSSSAPSRRASLAAPAISWLV
jgi:hypothetical protein